MTSSGETLIEVKGLKKYFVKGDARIDVLDGVDFSVSAGEMVALLGVSGAGKSTMMHILGGLEKPSEGEVLYDGRNIYSLGERGLSSFRNREIGFVFQFHHLLPEFSALENVMMPGMIGRALYEDTRCRAVAILENVGLAHRLDHKPGELSGGEQQRVAIARALMKSPRVMLADEPTGNLDSRTGDEVFSTIVEIARNTGLTCIMVTHNEKLASRFDRRLTVQDGRVIS